MTESGGLEAPSVIDSTYEVLHFRSGEPILDDWLKSRALKNLALGASRTFVVCPSRSRRVVGFYALAMGGIYTIDTPGSVRRNMPDVIPSVILGRLAVDESMQGRGLGAALLENAVARSLVAAESVSARLVVVHVISDAAERFYLRLGFTKMLVEGRTLALDLVKYKNF